MLSLSKVFSSIDNMQRHKKNIHEKKPVQCQNCKKVLAELVVLKRHKKICKCIRWAKQFETLLCLNNRCLLTSSEEEHPTKNANLTVRPQMVGLFIYVFVFFSYLFI